MIRIGFDPGADLEEWDKSAWDDWLAKARQETAIVCRCAEQIAARRAAAAAGSPAAATGDCAEIVVKSIWGDIKEILARVVFAYKCAYCEGPLSRRKLGHVDHYRPNGAVTVIDPSTGLRTPIVVGAGPHPGYYWLAYNWRNLLLACGACNSASKISLFPIESDRVHADAHPAGVDPDAVSELNPSYLDLDEQPLLLNPYVDDPTAYLRFGEHGRVATIDGNPRGQTSIDVYGLDHERHWEPRKKAQETAYLRWRAADRVCEEYGFSPRECRAFKEMFLAPIRSGKKPYFAAVIAYLLLKGVDI